jgi:hypothetical protein
MIDANSPFFPVPLAEQRNGNSISTTQVPSPGVSFKDKVTADFVAAMLGNPHCSTLTVEEIVSKAKSAYIALQNASSY